MSEDERYEEALDIIEEDAAEIGDLKAEIKRLKAIVNMLPKTADGVPAVPHWTTRLWYKHPDSGVIYERTFEADMEDARTHWVSTYPDRRGGERVWVGVEQCYSTREAAEKGVE